VPCPDAYISVYNTASQSVAARAPVLFAFNQLAKNMTHVLGSGNITVGQSGVYQYTAVLSVHQPCQFTIFVNGVAVPSTTIGINSGASQLTMDQLLTLNKGDVVSLVNYISGVVGGVVILDQGVGGDGTYLGANAELTLVLVSRA